MQVVRRLAARVALLAPCGADATNTWSAKSWSAPASQQQPPNVAVLLLSGQDPSGLQAAPFWILPGGGLAQGESPEQALRREVYEEVGAQLGELGPPAWHRRAKFVFDGKRWDQQELIYVARTPKFTPVAKGLTELEKRRVTAARWWPLDSLSTTGETIYPGNLASLIATWLLLGPPASPVQVS
jgi:8-oxo-dGTP pyrophosphatase MutT (NUDIX family)